MRRIPDILLNCQSDAERKLFKIIENVDMGSDWTAYHSLNCSEHAYKRWSEIDFLISGPDGVFVLEVKGGGVSVNNGIWTYTDRFGNEHRKSEGPFGQARSAMYALRNLLSDKYRVPAAKDGRAVFGFGVVFPQISWTEDTSEMPRVLVADWKQCGDSLAFRTYLRRLIAYWREKEDQPGFLSPQDLGSLRSRIRPDVDVYPPFCVRLGQALDNMQHLTDEQYQCLETIDANNRIIVTGGAGTGKTHLMLQCARRESALGHRVLIVVENPVLAEQIKRLEPEPSIEVKSFESLKKVAALGQADVLLVDEGQDLLELEKLAFLSDHVKGGLDDGRWRWFMDHNNQFLGPEGSDLEALAYLRNGIASGVPTEAHLRRNVRCTREIAERVQFWTGADLGRLEVAGFGTPPRMKIVESKKGLPDAVASVLERLLDNGIPAEEIGIVVASAVGETIVRALPKRLSRKCVPLDSSTVRANLGGRIVWGQARTFKGLEKPVILAIGFFGSQYASRNISELYVTLTRCNYGLWVFLDGELEKALAENTVRFACEHGRREQ